MPRFNPDQIHLGISACLNGQKVRFDGGHKKSTFCDQYLADLVTFTPICPEVGIGLPSPRKAIRLVKDKTDLIALRFSDGSEDLTAKMESFSKRTLPQFEHVSGFVLTANSPTCGMEKVRVYYDEGNRNAKEGTGLFAKLLASKYPNLPLEEDGRLNDSLLRENFIARVFAYHEWKQIEQIGFTKNALFKFHARHKYQLLAHNPTNYRKLGQLLASSGNDIEQIAAEYINLFMQSLKIIATRKNHTNVLQHIQGYFKKQLSPTERQDIASVILQYHKGMIPLLAPMTLLKHYLTIYPDQYIKQQSYFNPHPDSLKLRYGH